MTAYYNEIDPPAAAWLRELIRAGEIAPGIVDERSIEDVRPDELLGYTQCHFFAGIGGWSLALRLAGWPDDKPVWTGSCPCQPFSAAGKGAGFDDERHLWPAFQWLIQQCCPPVVAGEQVASKATGPWFDLVQADLEAMGYAFWLAAFPAAGIGAPHIRDRAYWLGHSIGAGLEGFAGHGGAAGRQGPDRPVAETGVSGRLADSGSPRLFPSAHAGIHSRENGAGARHGQPERPSAVSWLANPEHAGHGRPQSDQTQPGSDESNLGLLDGGHSALEEQSATGPTNGFWRAADWLLCRDGKWRPVEPGTFPLVDGIPRGVVQRGDISFPTAEARAMRLKGYGNAIVPQQAAIFIQAALGV